MYEEAEAHGNKEAQRALKYLRKKIEHDCPLLGKRIEISCKSAVGNPRSYSKRTHQNSVKKQLDGRRGTAVDFCL